MKLIRQEQELFYESRSKIADIFRQKHLCKYFNNAYTKKRQFKINWTKCKKRLVEQKAEFARKHEKWLILGVFREWKRVMPKLVYENKEREREENIKVLLYQTVIF